MIRYLIGNLLEDEAQALVNTVNTVGVMGKGIALQFKEAFPNNYREYHRMCKEGKLHVGEMLVTEEQGANGKQLIINFPTKTDWRKPSEYSYIDLGLKALRHEIENRNIRSIAIPPLGSNNGGLDWNTVRNMITEALCTMDCDIRIYEPSRQIQEKMKKERTRLTPARAMLLDMLLDMTRYGEYCSVFAAEKIVYFLQRFGAEKIFNIKFEGYIYGPYSNGKVTHVLYYLNGSYVRGMQGMQSKPFENIWLVEDTSDEISAFLGREEFGLHRGILKKAKSFLCGFYSDFALELLSTIDYLINGNIQFAQWRSVSHNELMQLIFKYLEQWSHRKVEMFAKEKYVDMALKHLDDYALLP